jgi:hypothetical protein
MHAPLKSFLEQLLVRHGALVDEIGEDALEVLFPPELAQHLGVGELERFSFPDVSQGTASPTPMFGQERPATRVVSYQSELLETLGGLLVGRVAVAAAALAEPLPVKRLALERDIERAMTLQNAVLRAQEQAEAIVPYLIFHFKYTALSDEQREGMISLAINERTLNVVEGLSELAPQLPVTTQLPDGVPEVDFEQVSRRAHRAAQSLIQDVLADFIKSMNRRFTRDWQRVTEYYRSIQQEIEMTIRKKGLPAESLERDRSRLRATEIELERKIRDLQTKYDLTVRIEAVAVLRLFLPVMLVSLTAMRRKWMVPIELAWNPLLRELERVACVGCLRPSRKIFICDDQHHTVCPECFQPCPSCQHPCCRACTPHSCPRCQKAT